MVKKANKNKSRSKPTAKVNDILDLRPRSKTRNPLSTIQNFIDVNKYLALIVIVSLTMVSFFYFKTEDRTAKLGDVISSVGKHILLPSDEEPTLANVEDKTKLRYKFLSSRAENGDEVLIYTKNQLVILYRPSIDKIIAVGSVTADLALPESKGATLTIMDGANDSAKTQELLNKIKTFYPEITITNGGKTNRQDFPKTIVIDNTNQKDNLLFSLVDLVSGTRGILPIGVEKASTDLMIIVGKE